jgi:hypoxanthine-DNA glycosylase
MARAKNQYSLPVKKKDIIRYSKGLSACHEGRLRHACDFDCEEGTSIYAIMGGLVVRVKKDSNVGGNSLKYWSDGNRVVIAHANGEYSAYEHFMFNGVVVEEGERVRRGKLIGYAGTTGVCPPDEPHLHFEVFNNPDPDLWEGDTLMVVFDELRKKGLGALVNQDTKVLIMGTMPGDESIRRQEYYASRTNDFWKIMSEVISQDLTAEDYKTRKRALLEAGVGLWDVFQSSDRTGSADAKIKEPRLNDFRKLPKRVPNLELVCLNGKKAGRYEEMFNQYETLILPSSSGANRRDQKRRLKEWMQIAEYL